MSHPTTSPNDIVIIGASRTPQGKLLGQLAAVSAVTLGATAIRSAIGAANIETTEVDQVIMGQVVQADAGQNPAKQAAIQAGIPATTPAMTVNSVCLSGLRAIIDAGRLLRLGDAAVVVAGGQESMSNAPHLLRSARKGVLFGSVPAVDALERDALSDAFNHSSMGVNTEQGNSSLAITREQQDEVAMASHQRAAAAWEEGIFTDEIAPVNVPQHNGNLVRVERDQGIRPASTMETLGKLRPAFAKNGNITAGNSSPISDGAASVVLTTREWAESRGIKVLATLGGAAHVAGPDTSLHMQPAVAIQKAIDRSRWSLSDLDFIEINEAFGAVAVASLAGLEYPLEKTNIHGGAIALGHPVGASGGRLVVHAAHELARRGTGRAAVALCGGGGQGDALLLWR